MLWTYSWMEEAALREKKQAAARAKEEMALVELKLKEHGIGRLSCETAEVLYAQTMPIIDAASSLSIEQKEDRPESLWETAVRSGSLFWFGASVASVLFPVVVSLFIVGGGVVYGAAMVMGRTEELKKILSPITRHIFPSKKTAPELFPSKEAPLQLANPHDMTDLMYATMMGNLATMDECLARNPAEVFSTYENGWNALHWAAYSGQTYAAEKLLALPEGKKLKATLDDQDNTPFMLAAEQGYADIVTVLIKDTRLEEITRANKIGLTARMYAERAKNELVLQRIAEAEAPLKKVASAELQSTHEAKNFFQPLKL